VDSATFLAVSISIPLRDFAPNRLVCLANSLKQRYPNRESIAVYIFSSQAAARASIFGQETTKEDLETLAQMHARYTLETRRHEEYVEIMPVGVTSALGAGAYSTRIDLPAAASPRCGEEVDKRCLIAMQEFAYPEAAGRRLSGKVTLIGAITQSGEVSRVRVLRAEASSESEKDLLTNTASEQFSSWRLEPGPRQEAIQITFSYVIDSSLHYKGETKVDWALPNGVTIRGSPPE